jgi:hypothetical protein
VPPIPPAANKQTWPSFPKAGIRYNTSDGDVLEDLHNVVAGSVAELGLAAFTDATQYGCLPCPEGKRPLLQFIKRVS